MRVESAPVLTYRATLRRQLQVEQTGWMSDGQVWFRRAAGERPAALRVDGTVRRLADRAGKEEVQATLWVNGADWVWLDRTARVVIEGKGPGLGGGHSAALAALLPDGWLEGGNLDPRRDWGQAKPSSFAGELCDVLETASETEEERWLIGPDRLPRQHVRRTRRGVEMIFVTTRFQSVTALRAAKPGTFTADVPDGFTKEPSSGETRSSTTAGSSWLPLASTGIT